MIEFILLATTVLYMGITSRISGSHFIDLPWGLAQWLFAIPYAIFAWLFVGLSPDTLFIYEHVDKDIFQWVASVLALLGGLLGKRTGHGNWMALPYVARKMPEPEWGEPILDLLFGKDPRLATKSNATALADIKTYGETKLYLRNITGMVLNGIFPSLVMVLLLLLLEMFVPALVLLVGSGLKGLAYAVSWLVVPHPGTAPWYVSKESQGYEYNLLRDEFAEATQFGEFFSGIFAGLGLVLAFILV